MKKLMKCSKTRFLPFYSNIDPILYAQRVASHYVSPPSFGLFSSINHCFSSSNNLNSSLQHHCYTVSLFQKMPEQPKRKFNHHHANKSHKKKKKDAPSNVIEAVTPLAQ